MKIYRKRWHLIAAFGIVLLPFFFILIFSRLTGVETRRVFIDLGFSLFRIGVAYAGALVLGVTAALFLARGRASSFFLPFFDVLQNFPSFALLPLFTLWFGVSNSSAILILILAIVWPVLFSTLSTVNLVRKDLEEAAEVFGARGWKKFLFFTIPVALPGILTGSLVGLGDGWEAIVAAEIIGVTPGIGGFLNHASSQGNIPVLAYGITALLLVIFSINKLIFLPLLKKSLEYSHD